MRHTFRLCRLLCGRDKLEYLLVCFPHGIASGLRATEAKGDSGKGFAIPLIGLDDTDSLQSQGDGGTGFVQGEVEKVCHEEWLWPE